MTLEIDLTKLTVADQVYDRIELNCLPIRSESSAQTYAAFRSVVSTAKLNKRSVLDDLRRVLATPSSHQAAQPG